MTLYLLFDIFEKLNNSILTLEKLNYSILTLEKLNPIYLLLVDDVCMDALRSKASTQQFKKAVGELARERVDELLRRLCDQEQLPLVGLGREVTLEPVLVPALLAAHLTKPS